MKTTDKRTSSSDICSKKRQKQSLCVVRGVLLVGSTTFFSSVAHRGNAEPLIQHSKSQTVKPSSVAIDCESFRAPYNFTIGETKADFRKFSATLPPMRMYDITSCHTTSFR